MRNTQAQTKESAPRNRGCAGIFFFLILVLGSLWGAGLGVGVWVLEDAERVITALEQFRPEIGSKVYSSDGELLGEFSTKKCELIALHEMPLYLQKAFIATEDDKFFEHKGVRPETIINGALYALKRGRPRGGSGITQQLARGVPELGVGKEETIQRKIREAIVSLQIERRFTKDEILELYLNQLFLGISAYGVEAAARQYFGKSCREVTLGEAAMLAGLARTPNNNDPFRHFENAFQRRDIVLGQMLDNGFITQAEHDAAVAEDLAAALLTPEKKAQLEQSGQGIFAVNKAPYFVEEVRGFVLDKYEVEEVFEDGLEIYTTLDMRLQRAAEETLFAALDEFDAKKKKSLEKAGKLNEFVPVAGALLCIDNRAPNQGFIRAMVGGRDFSQEKYNTATQARRQPGSSVKPFVWAAAIASGYTPSSIIVDEPFERIDGAGRPWRPQNFGGTYHGPISLRQALEKSVNIVSVKLVDQLGVPLVRSYLQRCGITTPIDDTVGLTLGLGSAEVTVLDQCVAYSCFANGGVRNDPVMITEIRNRDGLPRYDYNTFVKREQALDSRVAYVVLHMLEGVCTPDPKRGYYPTGHRTAVLGRPRGGKTGTTNQSRNVWFCGFTTDYTCVIWIGYRDNRSLGQGREFTGGTLAAPVWTKFMTIAEEGLPIRDFEVPAGITFYNIERLTAVAGGDYTEAYITGTAPPAQWSPPMPSVAPFAEVTLPDEW